MVKGQDGMGAEVFVMPGTHRRQIGNIVNCSQKWHGCRSTLLTFHKVDRVEFNFVASVYWALDFAELNF